MDSSLTKGSWKSGRKWLSFHKRLFLGLLVYSWLLVGCFAVFQYYRERQFKADEINVQLQLINSRILDECRRGNGVFDPDVVAPHPFGEMRISIIDHAGNVIYDNSLDSLPNTNHLNRKEIAEAVSRGSGYSLRRHSESTGGTYFYSAMRGGDLIVRTAVPYSVSLQELLDADFGFLWFMVGVTAVMCVIGFFATRRAAMLEEQEKICIRKQLTNNINHELKTPVSAIQVCLETLISRPELGADKRIEFLRRCYDNAQRLRRLLADVSVMTRMDDGSSAISMEPVNLSDVIVDACGDFAVRAADKGVEIAVVVPEELRMVGNHSLLSSVFHNLIDNALAYSGCDMVEIRLADKRAAYMTITVADNGCGVPEEHLPRLFERFYRVDKGRSRQMGGTGLGLAIVKNAVMLHGGAVTVVNRRAGGLEFEITLPLMG